MTAPRSRSIVFQIWRAAGGDSCELLARQLHASDYLYASTAAIASLSKEGFLNYQLSLFKGSEHSTAGELKGSRELKQKSDADAHIRDAHPGHTPGGSPRSHVTPPWGEENEEGEIEEEVDVSVLP
mgnify:CR=1 FL=1